MLVAFLFLGHIYFHNFLPISLDESIGIFGSMIAILATIPIVAYLWRNPRPTIDDIKLQLAISELQKEKN